jgi:ribosomal protein L2
MFYSFSWPTSAQKHHNIGEAVTARQTTEMATNACSSTEPCKEDLPKVRAVLLAALDHLHGGGLLVQLEVEAAVHRGENDRVVNDHL